MATKVKTKSPITRLV